MVSHRIIEKMVTQVYVFKYHFSGYVETEEEGETGIKGKQSNGYCSNLIKVAI